MGRLQIPGVDGEKESGMVRQRLGRPAVESGGVGKDRGERRELPTSEECFFGRKRVMSEG